MKHNGLSTVCGFAALLGLMTSMTLSANNRVQDFEPQVAEPGVLRILPMGDSITAGYTDNPKWKHPFEFGYRSHLYELLSDAGYSFEFVGESEEPWDGRYGTPTNQPSPDLRALGMDKHRGYGGWSIHSVHKNVHQWIDGDRPDIILLLIGINGIRTDSPKQLDALVASIFEADESLSLIVAQISPRSSFKPELYRYNAYIRESLLPKYKELGFDISTVDLYQHFLADKNDPESIDPKRFSNRINHPTNAYYKEMAQSWFDGIKRLLDSSDGKT